MRTPDELVGATERSVESVERDGRPAKAVVVRRTFGTTADDLWDALTDRDRLRRWFLPVTGDLRVGGEYQLEGNAGGEILECDPPRRLVVTWVFGGDTSWVTVTLRPHGGARGEDSEDGCELELRHVAHVPEELWDQYGPGATGIGWDLALVSLDHHVADLPFEGETWPASDDGRAFVARSGREWGDASARDGTPRADAEAAAERVTAFYTDDTG